jgi:hypothetical protein
MQQDGVTKVRLNLPDSQWRLAGWIRAQEQMANKFRPQQPKESL